MLSERNLCGISDNISFNIHLGYGDNSFVSDNVSIQLQKISLPLYLSYTFPTGRLAPFLNAGIINSFWTSTKFSAPKQYIVDNLNRMISDYQISGLVGAGISYLFGKYQILLCENFEYGSGINVFRNSK